MKLKPFSEKWVGKTVLLILVAYIAAYGFFVTKGFHLNQNFGNLVIAILPLMFSIDILKIILETVSKNTYLRGEEDISKISVIIPTYNGEDSLPPVLEDLLRRFDPKNIIVSSNGSTDKTIEIAKESGVRYLDIKAPIGKVKAINEALDLVKTPYVLILDDDTLIGSIKLYTSLLDDGYEAIAFTVIPKKQNWITRLQRHEYRKSMAISRVFHNRYGTVQNVSGAIGLFHTKELIRQKNLHTCEFSGEDLQRTLLIHMSDKNKGVIIDKSQVYTFSPTKIGDLFNQRVYGWAPGFYCNLVLFIKVFFRKNTSLSLRYEALYNVFMVTMLDIFRLIALPVLIFYPGFLIALYVGYVLLELITHARLQIKEPIWVILVYPFYGLFNFICRICAFYVFVYRRLTVIFSKKSSFDEYRLAPVTSKMVSYLISVFATVNLLAFVILYKLN